MSDCEPSHWDVKQATMVRNTMQMPNHDSLNTSNAACPLMTASNTSESPRGGNAVHSWKNWKRKWADESGPIENTFWDMFRRRLAHKSWEFETKSHSPDTSHERHLKTLLEMAESYKDGVHVIYAFTLVRLDLYMQSRSNTSKYQHDRWSTFRDVTAKRISTLARINYEQPDWRHRTSFSKFQLA